MNAFQVISIALLSVLVANAQVIAPGRCPKPAVQKDFDTTRVNITQYVVFFLSLFVKVSSFTTVWVLFIFNTKYKITNVWVF